MVGTDIARAMLGEGRHRTLIRNYAEAAAAFTARLRADAATQGPTSPLWAVIDEAQVPDDGVPIAADPVMALTIDVDGAATRWLTVLMTFGSAQDAGAEQLTIEQFLPADGATAALARAMALAGSGALN